LNKAKKKKKNLGLQKSGESHKKWKKKTSSIKKKKRTRKEEGESSESGWNLIKTNLIKSTKKPEAIPDQFNAKEWDKLI